MPYFKFCQSNKYLYPSCPRGARDQSLITARQIAAYNTQLLTQRVRSLAGRLKVATDHQYDALGE